MFSNPDVGFRIITKEEQETEEPGLDASKYVILVIIDYISLITDFITRFDWEAKLTITLVKSRKIASGLRTLVMRVGFGVLTVIKYLVRGIV